MAMKPPNVQWIGFDDEQRELLDFLDHLGNNGWDRNGQTDEVMPSLILELDQKIGHSRVKECMTAIGYGRDNLHMLDRWLSKARTGKFGR